MIESITLANFVLNRKKLLKQAKEPTSTSSMSTQGESNNNSHRNHHTSGESNLARETIARAVVQNHVKSIKTIKSSSLNDLSLIGANQNHTHKQRTNQTKADTKPNHHHVNNHHAQENNNANQHTIPNCSSSSSLLLRNVYTQIAYNDLKIKKIDQVRSQIWSQFLNTCLTNLNDNDAYVNNLCKKFQIFL